MSFQCMYVYTCIFCVPINLIESLIAEIFRMNYIKILVIKIKTIGI